MAHIIVLALAAAVYPTLLAGAIYLLTRPDPVRQMLAFLLGGMTMSVTIGLILLASVNVSPDVQSSARSPWVDVVLGVVTLALAAVMATGRPRALTEWRMRRKPEETELVPGPDSEKESMVHRALSSGSVPLAAVAGAVLNLPGVWYLAALKEISAGGYSTAASIALVLLFNVIMFTLVEVPLIAFVVSPEKAQERVTRFDTWLHTHRRQVAIDIATAVGIYLLIKGLAGLL